MEPASYRIIVRGLVTDRLAATLDGMTTEPVDAETALVGQVRDQTHLYGIPERIRRFGLDLVRLECKQHDSALRAGGKRA